MFTSAGTRAGRGESLGFVSKAFDRLFGKTVGTIIYRTTAGWRQGTISQAIDAGIGSTQGQILYRGASAWQALNPGSDGYILESAGSGANPSWVPAGGATSNWATIVDLDFSLLSNQTLTTDGNYTIGQDVNGNNITWTKAQSTNDSVAMAVTAGSGLVIQPKSTGTYSDTTRTAPYLYFDMATVVPNYYPGMPIQFWIYVSADNLAANADGVGGGIDNMSSSDSTIDQVLMSRQIIAGPTKDTRSQFALIAATTITNVAAALDNTDRVLMCSFPIGRINGNASLWKGAYSSGWPAYSSLVLWQRLTSSSLTFPSTNDTITGLPRKFVLYAQRNGSATALSVTIQRIRIDYQVR